MSQSPQLIFLSVDAAEIAEARSVFKHGVFPHNPATAHLSDLEEKWFTPPNFPKAINCAACNLPVTMRDRGLMVFRKRNARIQGLPLHHRCWEARTVSGN